LRDSRERGIRQVIYSINGANTGVDASDLFVQVSDSQTYDRSASARPTIQRLMYHKTVTTRCANQRPGRRLYMKRRIDLREKS
jgi:hypothetical protein